MHNETSQILEYIDYLQKFIERHYNITIKEISEATRGFFGETWIIKTQSQSYFVKISVDCVRQDAYKDSFSVIEFINSKGINCISKIIKTKEGELYTIFDGRILGVFEFVEGEHTEDYSIEELFKNLSQIYKLDTTKLVTKHELFDEKYSKLYYAKKPELYKFFKRKNELKLLNILDEKAGLIDYYAMRLKNFSTSCKNNQDHFYITHGDAGGNIIVNKKNFVIVDWDQVMLSTIERDIWVFNKEPQLKMIQNIIKQNGINYELDAKRLCYYTYSMFFYYMCAFILRILGDFPNSLKQKSIKGMEDLFTGWMTPLLKNIETIDPESQCEL